MVYFLIKIDIIVNVSDCSKGINKCLLALEKDSSKFNKIIFVCNQKSLNELFEKDFVYSTFNEALAQVENDCIVINSNVIISQSCVQKLFYNAYLQKEIGLSFPLSNKLIFHDEMPDYFKIESMIEKFFLDEKIEVTLDYEYCFFMKKEVIQYIDRKRDISVSSIIRDAKNMGYKIILNDNAFVYDNSQENLSSKINEDENLKKWLDKIIDNFKIYYFVNNGKRNIFYLIHADFHQKASNNIGGTQFHVKDLTCGLKKDFNIFVMSKDNGSFRFTIYIENTEKDFKFLLDNKKIFPSFFNDDQRKIYELILKSFEIDLVHVHHTMELSLDIFYVAKELEIPTYLTIHDFYYLCPAVNFLNERNEYCLSNEMSKISCKTCIGNKLKTEISEKYILKWREESQRIFDLCTKIIVPSLTVKNILISLSNNILDKIYVVEHGIDISKRDSIKDISCKKTFNVAFIGGITITKGSELIYDLITTADKSINWFIFGGILDEKLSHLEQRNLRKFGWYKRENLNMLLVEHDIDLICILSIVPETFCYTLSESIASGIPVLVNEIGALGERVKKMQCGWSILLGSPAQLYIEKLHYIFSNPSSYSEKQRQICKLHIKSINEMINEYKKIYNELDLANKKEFKVNSQDIQFLYEACYPKDICHLNSEIIRLREELAIINNTLGYKLVCTIRQNRLPFLKVFKSLARKFIK